MADTKTTALTENTAPATTDIFPHVDDPAGTPVTKKMTFANLLKVVNGLTEDTAPDTLADYVLTYDTSASAAKKVKPQYMGSLGGKYPMDARLTLETGVAISTSDQTAKTTLYLTKYKGDQVAVYDGSSGWTIIALTSDLSITLASLTAGLPYDVFVYSNSGTLTLELTAWTNTTTRATALTTQNGVYVKTGATTRRYLGTICIVATGQCEDSGNRRMVWNYYNREPRILTRINTTSHTYATGSWRAWNNSAANSQVEFVLGEATNIMGIYRANTTVAGGGAVAFGVNTTTAPGGSKGEQFNNATDAASSDMFSFVAGYNYWCAVEYGAATFNTERISMTLQVLG